MKRVLFVCSQNRLRSPAAEQVFARRANLEVQSAGTNNDADTPLTRELVEWADIIFVMEKAHRRKLQQRFRAALKAARPRHPGRLCVHGSGAGPPAREQGFALPSGAPVNRVERRC